jgi:signal transduction histidine kinase
VILFALAVAGATLLVGVGATLLVRRLPTLRGRLVALVAIALALPLGAVLLSGAVMLEEGHDLVVLLVAAAASTAALGGAWLLVRSIASPAERLRAASRRIAAGDLSARAPEDGPAELAQLGASFNEMARNLEELFDARRQLVAAASHDLRTPISALRAMIEAVEDGLAEPERYLPEMRAQVEALARLVDDLFELARIDSGALRLELREAQLGALVESCLRSMEAEARARGVSLEVRLDAELPAVRCAPDHVRRVLANLLVNALRHTPADGSVAVLVERPPAAAEVRVTVQDSGEGLSAEGLRRAFERFWRGDQARSEPGAGLGLAIARGLVEAQGGRVWAENGAGGGARISFTLPLAA